MVCVFRVAINVPIASRRVILMLKYPRPGAVKTRLIPALGERRACELYRSLVQHTLGEVARFSAAKNIMVEARVAGAPDESAARTWLGPELTITGQGEGDLGQRMERAVRAALADGADQVVVIGGDCPGLTAAHLNAAFAALVTSDVVVGPATDGGYYLIGMRRPLPALFQGMAWGGPEVLAQTFAAARTIPVDVVLLDPLRDLDVPGDLSTWTETAAARAAGVGGVAVIIPTFNEEHPLPSTLAAVQRGAPHEIIVTDGGSTDRTAAIARGHEAIFLSSPPGRARQMNRGAAIATGEYLLFLHADTLLPPDFPRFVRQTLAQPGVVGGAFKFAIAGEFPGRRLIERGTNRRACRSQLPYGDQGLFVSRAVFDRVGGFPDQPIMEDYAFVKRLQRLGRIAMAPATAVTSGRRWQRRGALGTTLLNQLIVLGYRLGVSPVRLARWYRGE